MGVALANLLIKFCGKWITVILDLFSKGAWRKVGAYTTMMALIGTLYLGVNAILSGLYRAMPNAIQIAASWIIPDNAAACITAYIFAATLITLYKMKARGIQMSLGL